MTAAGIDTKYPLNGKSTTDDLRLNFAHLPNWQVGTRQLLQGSDYVVLEPTSKIDIVPKQVEFDLPDQKSLLMGPMTKFQITGGFQVQKDGETSWANVPSTEHDKVLLAPFWFEMLIKEISVFHNNYKVSSTSESRFISAFLHAYLHAQMDPVAKKLLCPQESHPAYCLPQENEKWTVASKGWKSYAKAVFVADSIRFEYIPLFLFPFYQGPNFMMDAEGVPRILHMPTLGRVQVRFTFHDTQDRIFQQVTGNKNKYRFAVTDFKMILEEARLSPAHEKQLQKATKPLIYPGVTRLQLVETIPDASSSYRTRFQDVVMPEALFVFCLDKTVVNGTYEFKNETKSNIFRDHNIQSYDLRFNGMRFSIAEPHMGNFRKDEMDSKQLFDHIYMPPFGIRQNIDLLTYSAVSEGSSATAFPHIYIPLTKGPDRQRIVPALDNGSVINKRADLEIDFKFTTANSAVSSVYVIYACYTDVNMIYDNKNRVFYSPYLNYMN